MHPGVFGRISHAEDVVHNLAIVYDAVVVIELGLDASQRSDRDRLEMRRKTAYLAPGYVGAVDGFDQLRVVEIDEVRADAHNRAVLLVELLHLAVVVTGPHEKEAPQVGPSCDDAYA